MSAGRQGCIPDLLSIEVSWTTGLYSQWDVNLLHTDRCWTVHAPTHSIMKGQRDHFPAVHFLSDSHYRHDTSATEKSRAVCFLIPVWAMNRIQDERIWFGCRRGRFEQVNLSPARIWACELKNVSTYCIAEDMLELWCRRILSETH